MPIDFSQHERGAPFAGDFAAELDALRERIAATNLAQIVHGKRVIVLFEGWVGSGKKQALKCLCAAFDPCHLTVHCFRRGQLADNDRHWFAPFWAALPGAGDTSMFLGSWFSRAIDTRAAGGLADKAWTRMLDEINEFEAQQRDHGTVLVKLFFHVSAEVQQANLGADLADPWKQHLVSEADLERAADRAGWLAMLSEVYDATNTRWAPWKMIDAADPKAAQIAVMRHVAEAMAKGIPAEPPARAGGAEIVDFQSLKRG